VKDRVLVSAHRALDFGLEAALGLPADFVEFDVRRMPDGRYVIAHDLPADGEELIPYDDLLAALAGRGVGAHVDLKIRSPAALYAELGQCHEVEVVRRALEVVPADRMVVTTGSERAARALRDWADEHAPDILVGLSIGGDVRNHSWRSRVGVRFHELFPRQRLRSARADVVAAHFWLARLTVSRWARRHGYRVLVWTVDGELPLRHWLKPGRVWMVTTNRPDLAVDIERARRRHPAWRGRERSSPSP
jgi:glycerophosphoryl diester phosphodiesterase